MKLINLKRSKKKAKDDVSMEVAAGFEYYPWGFQLTMDDETIDKFKSLEGAKLSNLFQISAIGKLTQMSINESEGSKKRKNITIQIQKINLSRKGSDRDSFNEFAE